MRCRRGGRANPKVTWKKKAHPTPEQLAAYLWQSVIDQRMSGDWLGDAVGANTPDAPGITKLAAEAVTRLLDMGVDRNVLCHLARAICFEAITRTFATLEETGITWPDARAGLGIAPDGHDARSDPRQRRHPRRLAAQVAADGPGHRIWPVRPRPVRPHGSDCGNARQEPAPICVVVRQQLHQAAEGSNSADSALFVPLRFPTDILGAAVVPFSSRSAARTRRRCLQERRGATQRNKERRGPGSGSELFGVAS